MSRPRTSRALALVLLAVACAGPEHDLSQEDRPGASADVVRVAVCQLQVGAGREAGLADVDRALATGAADGAELACFPEVAFFGWVNPEAHASADPIPGPTTARLGQLARRHGLMIAIGIAERAGEGLYNAVVLIDSDGRLLARHRKTNVLAELMDPPYTPGEGALGSVADTRLGRIGLLICADTFLDEVVAELAAQRPELVVVPYGWAAPAESWPEHGESLQAWVTHTARRTGAPVVGVDGTGTIADGPWTGYVLGGQSVVCTADGAVLAVLADREPEVRVFDVPLARVETE